MTESNGSYFPIFSTTIEKQKKKERRFDQLLWPMPLTTMQKSRDPQQICKQDIEDTMNAIYGEEWKTYTCCKYLFDHLDQVRSNNKAILWADKYKPTQVDGLLGSLENHTYVRDWLEKLKVKPISAVGEKKKKKKSQEEDELYNLLVLVGECGSGKTASVLTAAKETGYAISEMNPSSRRTGKDVIDTLGGMTESHLVRFDSHTQKRKFEGEKLVLRDTVKKKKTFDMMQHFKKPSAEPMVIEETQVTTVKKEHTIQSFFEKTREKMKRLEIEKKIKSQPKQSLILLEEVDLLYEEDKGFWPSVYELNRKSKRPIILTCNDETLIPFDNLYIQDIIYYDLPEQEELACYIQLICLIENHFIEPIDISYICSYFDYDTRRILENLQLWLNENLDEHFHYPYLFAHMIGFSDLIQQPKTPHELADRLQGLTVKKQDLCKQYYFEAIIPKTKDEEVLEIETICSLMERASFADAFIDLTEKQRHQLYDIDQYSKQDAYSTDLKMIFKEPSQFDHWENSQIIESSFMISNTAPIIESKVWRDEIIIWSSQWEKLVYQSSRYFQKTHDIIYPSLLDFRLSRNIEMMEYLPEIRSLCNYDQGIAGKGRHRRTRKRIRYINMDSESREYIDWERKV